METETISTYADQLQVSTLIAEMIEAGRNIDRSVLAYMLNRQSLYHAAEPIIDPTAYRQNMAAMEATEVVLHATHKFITAVAAVSRK